MLTALIITPIIGILCFLWHVAVTLITSDKGGT